MNHTTLLVGLVLTLGIPVAATLASFTVNAQQLSTSPSSSIPRTTAISENLKSEMCDPSNPSLKVVNTTEARICNIPKNVKSVSTTGITTLAPSTSGVSQQLAAKTPKSTSLAVGPAFPSQQIGPQNNVASRSGDTTTSAVSSLNSKSLTALQAIASQASAINKQQEQLRQLAATSNDTASQNYTFASTTAAIPN